MKISKSRITFAANISVNGNAFMKIAINTRFLLKDKLEGIGVFSHEILQRLVKSHPEHEFVFIFDRPYDHQFIYAENVKPEVIFPPARHPVLWLIWYEWSLQRLLKQMKPDMFISMDGMLPLRIQSKSVAVIHDIAFESLPDAVPLLVRVYYRYFFPRYAQKADRIITASHFSKFDLSKRYKIPEEKIVVVHNGPGEEFKPVNADIKRRIKAELTADCDFFLYTGALHPRKNISNLMRAFDTFKAEDKNNIKLVIAGRKAWKTKNMEKVFQSMKYRDDVIFTGWLSQQFLSEVTASAFAFIYVSLFEGFGIPVLNAMCCDVPVITSNLTSLPEVAGEAALLVDPQNVEDIAGAMKQITASPELREALIENGRKQREKFNWKKSSDSFWEVLDKI